MTSQTYEPTGKSTISLTIWVGAILLAALTFRLAGLTTASIWLDEAYSLWFAAQDWGYLWGEVPAFETHPPFYYSLLKLWIGAFGDSAFSVRLLSTLLNLATLPFVAGAAFLLGGADRGRTAAVLATVLFAFSDKQILASQDARPYALMSLALAMMLYSAIAIMRQPERSGLSLLRMLRRDPAMFATYICLAFGFALMCWSHNIGPLFCLIFGTGLLLWWALEQRSLNVFCNVLFSAVLSVLFYAPNLPIILMQLSTLGNNGFWLFAPSIRDAIKVALLLPMGVSLAAGAFFLICAAMGLVYLWRAASAAGHSRMMVLILPLMAVTPGAVAFIMSRISQPIFLDRTLQSSQIPIILMMAFAPFLIAKLRLPVVVLLLCGAVASSLTPHDKPKENWRSVIANVQHHAQGGTAKVVAFPASAKLPLQYYIDKMNAPVDLYPLTGEYPVRGPEYTYPAGGGGVPELRAEDMPGMQKWLGDSDTVWFVSRLGELFDPAGLLQTFVEAEYPCELLTTGHASLRSQQNEAGTCPTPLNPLPK